MNDNYHIKVENYNSLVRDIRSNAIINTDKDGYERYKSLKKSKSMEKIRIDQIESDLSNLKNDISEIKDLLKFLIKD